MDSRYTVERKVANGMINKRAQSIAPQNKTHPRKLIRGGIINTAIRCSDIIVREIAEFTEQSPDGVFAFAGELDELSAGNFFNSAIGFAVQFSVKRFFSQF